MHPINDTIIRITKITNEMLEHEKELPECLKYFETYLNKSNLIFVAHNGNNFDRFFLKRNGNGIPDFTKSILYMEIY